MILFVATDEELAALRPMPRALGDTGGASIVPPVVDPASDYERFLEERAPARLRTMPHVIVSFDVEALGFTRRGDLFWFAEEDAASLAEIGDDALGEVAERWLGGPAGATAILTLRKLARVAVQRDGHVLAHPLEG